jgi:uncharacterized protein YidB (DUF937 family)
MGLFDDIVGGVLGGALGGQGGSDAGSLFEIVNQMGGLDAVMDRLRAGGLDDQIGTWISQGANQHVTPERIRAILGDGMIAQAARGMGLTPERISEIIAEQLPHIIDRMTPDGTAPGGGFGDLLGQVLRR